MWIRDRASLNFEPLRSHHLELASMGGYAEHYAFSDLRTSRLRFGSSFRDGILPAKHGERCF